MNYVDSIKKFSKKYALPLTATLIFMVLVAGLLIYRHNQLSGLPSQLLESSSSERSDTKLISKDQADKIQSRDDTLLTLDPSAAPQSPPPSSSPPPPAPGPAPPPPPPSPPPGSTPVFSASASSIRYLGSSSQTNTDPRLCTEKHKFEAIVSTSNGPGQVKYYWERNNGETSPAETLNAGNGQNHYSITHAWSITTPKVVNYDGWVRLVITHPNSSQSQRAEFTHSCGGT